jgi:N-methylhydantoinase A
MGKYRITVDTGGTFTDVVYYDEERSEIAIHKLPSTPHDPSEAILGGVQALIDRGVAPADIEYFCHGTTVGTNALLEGKGARTGLILTEGFRGIYEVGEQSIPYGPTIFNMFYEKPAKLAPQSLTCEVGERVDFQGHVLKPLDDATVRAAARHLKRKNVKSVAVCLLFSFLHPQHEQRVRDILKEEMPDVSVSLSSEVLPQIREYFRLSTTVINAYLQPVLERYIASLGRRIEGAGVKSKKRYIMQSNGGTSTFESTAKKAVATVLSGPAGGMTAGVTMARDTGHRDLITFDMGGTSCDVALIKDAQPSFASRVTIDGRVIALPMMDINTVSAGGGTIARVTNQGMLEVGPDSAGAVPGPACYGRGGELPTVTDANMALGYFSETNFLGGRMRLERARAVRAVEEKVAKPLGLATAAAAEGIVRIINVKMEEAIKAISTMRGYDLRDFMLVAFGGAGPLHSSQMARDLGMKGVIVPLYPGVNSAIGLLQADVKHDHAMSRLKVIAGLAGEEASGHFATLAAEAKRELLDEGFAESQIVYQWGLDMRYAGQGYEITVPVKSSALSDADVAAIRRLFDETHKQQFGHSAPGEPVEVVTYRVAGIGQVPEVKMPHFKPEGRPLDDARLGSRNARFDGADVAADVYQRERLDVGHRIKGPAIVEQLDATLVIPPGQIARVDEWKNIIVTEEA